MSKAIDNGLAGCPKADAMLRQVDPFGIAQGDGAVGGILRPPALPGPYGSKPLEVLAVLATAVGSAVVVVAGLKAVRATTNPRARPSRTEMIAALGLEPEGRTRGSKYAATTQEFWDKIRYKNSEDAREARRKLGIEG